MANWVVAVHQWYKVYGILRKRGNTKTGKGLKLSCETSSNEDEEESFKDSDLDSDSEEIIRPSKVRGSTTPDIAIKKPPIEDWGKLSQKPIDLCGENRKIHDYLTEKSSPNKRKFKNDQEENKIKNEKVETKKSKKETSATKTRNNQKTSTMNDATDPFAQIMKTLMNYQQDMNAKFAAMENKMESQLLPKKNFDEANEKPTPMDTEKPNKLDTTHGDDDDHKSDDI